MAHQTPTAEVERPATAQAASSPNTSDAMPLPGWLMRIYYVFPIVLYIPDAIFNFFVYSDGSGIDWQNITLAQIPYIVLWGFLAAGVVGMAWLLSVFAPWHWARRNHFQAIMCWVGVIIATAITIWNSLAFRSQHFLGFKTDALLPIGGGFSVTMILVAVAPPFWGLFWAIVQPATNKRDAALEKESHLAKIERMQQEAEIKRLRAEANAQIRAAQITGLAATARAARAQIGAAITNTSEQPAIVDGSVTVTPVASPPPPDRMVALPTGGSIRRLADRRQPPAEETTESGEHEVIRGTAVAGMAYSVAAEERDAVFEAPTGEQPVRPLQGMLPLDGRAAPEHETLLSTARPALPRASTLLRNYAEGEHVMRAVDADIEKMRARGLKITIKSFAEFRGIELSLSKQLLAKWREWKQQQQARGEAPFEVAE